MNICMYINGATSTSRRRQKQRGTHPHGNKRYGHVRMYMARFPPLDGDKNIAGITHSATKRCGHVHIYMARSRPLDSDKKNAGHTLRATKTIEIPASTLMELFVYRVHLWPLHQW